MLRNDLFRTDWQTYRKANILNELENKSANKDVLK